MPLSHTINIQISGTQKDVLAHRTYYIIVPTQKTKKSLEKSIIAEHPLSNTLQTDHTHMRTCWTAGDTLPIAPKEPSSWDKTPIL